MDIPNKEIFALVAAIIGAVMSYRSSLVFALEGKKASVALGCLSGAFVGGFIREISNDTAHMSAAGWIGAGTAIFITGLPFAFWGASVGRRRKASLETPTTTPIS
jgi:hypothetical protein